LNTATKILCAVMAGLILMISSMILTVAAKLGGVSFAFPFGEDAVLQDEVLMETEPEVTETEPYTETVPQTIPEETQPVETQAPEIEYKIYDTVPLYFQEDYPDTMFGAGTVADSGCSITCLAMVATYMTNHEYLPDELAGYFGAHAENNMNRMLYGMEQMRLPYQQCENWDYVMADLRSGKVVILMMDHRSIFTDTQHFVVLTGITDDGLILVNDSNRDNYDRWDLKEKLISGFPQEDLCRGFNGAWCFDKSLMPENPFIYYEEEVYVEPRYVGMTLTMDEREMLARMVWVEARGEPIEGQQAVAEIVFNRLRSDHFPDTLRDVNDIRAKAVIYTGEAAHGLYPGAFIHRIDSPLDRHVFAQSERVREVSGRVVPAHALGRAQQARASELMLGLGAVVDRGVARFVTGEVELTDENYAAWLGELQAAGSAELVKLFADAQE